MHRRTKGLLSRNKLQIDSRYTRTIRWFAQHCRLTTNHSQVLTLQAGALEETRLAASHSEQYHERKYKLIHYTPWIIPQIYFGRLERHFSCTHTCRKMATSGAITPCPTNASHVMWLPHDDIVLKHHTPNWTDKKQQRKTTVRSESTLVRDVRKKAKYEIVRNKCAEEQRST